MLGGENTELLKAIGVDVKLLTQASNMADELSVVLAAANGEVGDDQSAKKMRDKAYSLMKAAVDEIRAVGQYTFWRDEDRKKGYASQYLKRLRTKSRMNRINEEVFST